jgi:hypothetical protein
MLTNREKKKLRRGTVWPISTITLLEMYNYLLSDRFTTKLAYKDDAGAIHVPKSISVICETPIQ